jgi:hypothetical protein
MIMQDSSGSDLYAADLPSISHNLCSCLQVNLYCVSMFAHASFMDFMAGTYKSPFSICFDWNASAQQRPKKGEPNQKIGIFGRNL